MFFFVFLGTFNFSKIVYIVFFVFSRVCSRCFALFFLVILGNVWHHRFFFLFLFKEIGSLSKPSRYEAIRMAIVIGDSLYIYI